MGDKFLPGNLKPSYIVLLYNMILKNNTKVMFGRSHLSSHKLKVGLDLKKNQPEFIHIWYTEFNFLLIM